MFCSDLTVRLFLFAGGFSDGIVAWSNPNYLVSTFLNICFDLLACTRFQPNLSVAKSTKGPDCPQYLIRNVGEMDNVFVNCEMSVIWKIRDTKVHLYVMHTYLIPRWRTHGVDDEVNAASPLPWPGVPTQRVVCWLVCFVLPTVVGGAFADAIYMSISVHALLETWRNSAIKLAVSLRASAYVTFVSSCKQLCANSSPEKYWPHNRILQLSRTLNNIAQACIETLKILEHFSQSITILKLAIFIVQHCIATYTFFPCAPVSSGMYQCHTLFLCAACLTG